MPRSQKIHSEEKFEEAKVLHRDGASLRKISRLTGIPYATVHDHVKGKYLGYNTTFGPVPYLTIDEESSLVGYIKYLGERGFPLTRSHIKTVCKEIIKSNGKNARLNLDKGPSDVWLKSFLDRHKDLSVRTAHQLEKERAMVTQENVDEFYTLLENALIKNDMMYDGTRIYNCDETGFSGKFASSKKVVVGKGTRHPYQIQVGLSGHISVLLAISAAGKVVAPFVIYSGCLPKKDYSNGLPEGWMFDASMKGFMTNELFLKWFLEGFVPSIGSRRPVLLLLDNLSSHVSFRFVQAAAQCGVDLLFFPSHSSHLLQPLDVGFFHNLKQKFANLAVQLGYFGSKSIGKELFPKLLHLTLNKIPGEVVASSFADPGIFPLQAGKVSALKDSLTSQPCPTSKHTGQSHVQTVDIDIPGTSTGSSKCRTTPEASKTNNAEHPNMLIRLGIINENLSSILVEPPSLKQSVTQPKKTQKRTYRHARYLPANQSEPIHESLPEPERTEIVICPVCLTNRRLEWVGCDNCPAWYHYSCLPYAEQCAVDISIASKTQWLCNECRFEE